MNTGLTNLKTGKRGPAPKGGWGGDAPKRSQWSPRQRGSGLRRSRRRGRRGGNMVNQVVDHLKKTGLQVMNQEVTPGNVVKVINKAVDKAVQAVQRGGGGRRRRRR